jgi:thioredoxin-related protein
MDYLSFSARFLSCNFKGRSFVSVLTWLSFHYSLTFYFEQFPNFAVKSNKMNSMRRLFTYLVALFFALSVHGQAPVKWYTIEEAFVLTKKEPRKIIIDVYTDWCSWCKVMDNKTFSNQIIADYLNKNFYPVKFNAEQKADVSVYGKTYKFVASGTRGYHELAAELLNGQLGYPSIVFLDEQTKMIQPVQGYIQAKQFDEIVKFIGGDFYKNKKWEDFQASYVSPVKE